MKLGCIAAGHLRKGGLAGTAAEPVELAPVKSVKHERYETTIRDTESST